ncbi:MAG: F0F1 ATP synthase subunit alpha [Deltaproteobacteria bacterium HGW-Deltaproteobacteria-15]|nr:MAG: F0F1 ATP synthase subunit alpha [Deltaproteobacteria bacterium HGW-Deltaproteobacteria-15]
MNRPSPQLNTVVSETFDLLQRTLDTYRPRPRAQEVGIVTFAGPAVVRVKGLRSVQAEELILFEDGRLGMAFNVDEEETGVVLLDEHEGIWAGSEAERTGRVLDVPAGEQLLGRVVDPQGRPLDGREIVRGVERRPMEGPAPALMDRLPVTVPLQTGIKVVDALIPIGRGQRELILGDRQTGKTAIALDTIINQRDKGMICIYCAVGKRDSAVARAVSDLRERGAMEYSVVVVANEKDPPGIQFVAPYAAMSIGEYFMEKGSDVLVVFDDLTRHARAYREISLLLRRPPGREAFPGDIFYIHSRLLERSTHLKRELGGGSLTALPIVETEAQNISAYIPTNLISITDGQIYLSPELFQKGTLPAVDVGKSVSRVGGKTQLAAYRAVAGDLRLSYSQFEELEAFARFGTQLDEDTRNTLERGRRVREILKQPQYEPLSVPEQIAVLVAVNEGVFDSIPLGKIAAAQQRIWQAAVSDMRDLAAKISQGDKLTREEIETIRRVAESATGEAGHGNP